MAFVWNEEKAESNLQKHGVSFDEPVTAFTDPLSAVILDPLHSADEDRFVLMGLSHQGRLLVVIHTDRGEDIRLISARPADGYEKKHYEQGTP